MHLVQLLLPLRDNDRLPYPPADFADVRRELTERFGGLTAYSRSPAEGLWKDDDGRATRDQVVVYEVMVPALDRDWWREYRSALEKRFRQEELVVRAQLVERL